MIEKHQLGCAVIGMGVGESYIPKILEHSSAELCWVVDTNLDKATAVVSRHNGGKATSNYLEALADDRVDLVAIASYDDAHFEQVMAALHAKKHVFVEKPICLTYDELVKIKAAWAAHSGKIQLRANFILRKAPLYIWLKEFIANGELGQIYAFDGDYLYGRRHKITDGWRKDITPYSVMSGGGIHLVDLMLWLTGESPITVTSAGTNIATRGTSFRYADFMATTFKYTSGLIGRITANFGCENPHHHVIRVFGTCGTFIYDDQGPRLYRSRTGVSEFIPHTARPKSKGELIPDFIDAIERRENILSPTLEVFNTMSVCFACNRALAEDRPIDVVFA